MKTTHRKTLHTDASASRQDRRIWLRLTSEGDFSDAYAKALRTAADMVDALSRADVAHAMPEIVVGDTQSIGTRGERTTIAIYVEPSDARDVPKVLDALRQVQVRV